MAEHNLDSVRKEDGQKGGQHPLLKRRLVFGRCANNHPGRGSGRCKALRQKRTTGLEPVSMQVKYL